MFAAPPSYGSGRGNGKRGVWIALGIILFLLILAAGFCALAGLGTVALFYPKQSDNIVYLAPEENPGSAYQFNAVQNEQALPDLKELGSIDNSNTKNAGLLWFEDIRILGSLGGWMESTHFNNGKGTSFAVEKGNVEILGGSIFVAGDIEIAGDLRSPVITELVDTITTLRDRVRTLENIINNNNNNNNNN
jgi:hypothetical protein